MVIFLENPISTKDILKFTFSVYETHIGTDPSFKNFHPQRWQHAADINTLSVSKPRSENLCILFDTVGGRNLAPVDIVNIPLFTRFYTSQVVQDFFHQQ